MKNSRTRTTSLLPLLLLLIVPGALRGADREPGSMSLVGESDVTIRRLTFSVLEVPSDMSREAIVHELFPTKEEKKVHDLFSLARWDFRPDGTFQLTSRDFIGEAVSIEGFYRRTSKGFEIQMFRQFTLLGPTISLDGWLRETEAGYRLDAVFSGNLMTTERLAAGIQQVLREGEPPPQEDRVTWVLGIPQPSVFEVQVEGSEKGRKLPSAPGLLYVREADRFGPLSVKMMILSLPINLSWLGPSETTSSAGYRLEASDGHLKVQFDARRGGAVEVFWNAPIPIMDAARSKISPDRGNLDLEFQGDKVSGKISIEATLGESKAAYEAILEGRRTDISSFEFLSKNMPPDLAVVLDLERGQQQEIGGVWNIQDGGGRSIGKLSLVKTLEGQLTGSLLTGQRETALVGQAGSGRAELQESGDVAGTKWLLRLLPGGDLLVGLRYRVAPGVPEILVGWRLLPAMDESSTNDLFTKNPMLGMNRGVFLALQGRCSEAVRSFESAIQGIRDLARIEKGQTDPALLKLFLSVGVEMLDILGSCDLQSGDGESYLRHLRLGWDLLRSIRSNERKILLGEMGRLRGQLKDCTQALEMLLRELESMCGQLSRTQGSDPEQISRVAGLTEDLKRIDELLSEQLADFAVPDSSSWQGRDFTTEAKTMLEQGAQYRQSAREVYAWLSIDLRKALERDTRLARQHDAILLSLSDFRELTPESFEHIKETSKQHWMNLGASMEFTRSEKSWISLRSLAAAQMIMLDSLLQPSPDLLWLVEQNVWFMAPVELATKLATFPESFRSREVTDGGKINALEKLQPFFDELIRFLADEGRAEESLAVSEISRSRALADLLAGKDKIRQGLETVRARLGADALPSPVAVSPPSLKTILDIVQQRESTTVEYFLTDQQLLLWVISPDREVRVESRPVDRKTLRASIDELRDLLGGRAVADPQRTRELLRSLYSLLISPVLDHLPSSPQAVLTLIPHQELFGVPFAALQNENGAPLIAQRPLTYGTSIATLGQIHKNREALPAGAAPRLLALINPRPLAAGSRGQALPPLDLVESQFSAIADFFPEESRVVLKGSQATEKALIASTGPSVLHLVTHGEFVEDDPLSSYIALAADGGPGDGLLRVPEVFHLDLPAELVVLWACETGRGGISADGVEGLSRGFLWAGAASLLLSLWEIPEQESLIQMYGFHDFWLRQGLSKARALQKAQIEQSRLYPDQPGLWAGFVLYGEAK